MNFKTALLPALMLSFLTACATTPAPVSVVDTAAARPELSTLKGLITSAGLEETLKGPGPFTVFAPTNDAFAAVPKATLEALGKDKEQLKAVLGYHVLPGRISSAEVKTGPVKSVQGAPLALSKAGSFVTVEDAVVTTPDIVASNGVVHLVDRVLMPPKR